MQNVQEEHSDDLMNILVKRADHWSARDLQKYEDYMNVASRNPKAFDLIAARVPIKVFDRRNEPGHPVDGVPFQTVSPSDVFPTPHYAEILYALPIGPPVFGGIDWKPNARPPPTYVQPSSLHLEEKVPHPSGSHSSTALEGNKSKNSAPSRTSPQNSLYAKRINLDFVLARKQRNMKLKTRRIQKALLKSPRSKASNAKALATKTRTPRFIVGTPTRSPPRGRATYKKNIVKNGLKVRWSGMHYLLEADVAMEDNVTGSGTLRGSEEDGESEAEYDEADGDEGGEDEEGEDNDEQDEADERVLGSIYHDVSDIKPWGKPRTEDHIVIENIRAIAKKYWHVIKGQDEKCRLGAPRTVSLLRSDNILHSELNLSCRKLIPMVEYHAWSPDVHISPLTLRRKQST